MSLAIVGRGRKVLSAMFSDYSARVLGCLAIIFVAACSGSSSDIVDAGVDSAAPDMGVDAELLSPYSITVIDNARISSISEEPNFQQAEGSVPALHDAPFARVTLVVDLASTCFPFESWVANPPPSGQNWPADCDAFDRNFETSLVDPTLPGAPALELIRAVTPFGGPMHIEQDVTDVMNTIASARTMRIVIPTWSDGAGQVSGSHGGWNVSARLDVTPGTAPVDVLAVLPLVYESISVDNTSRSIDFVLPEGTTHTRVEYRATGHGGGEVGSGCIGPADEFCMRSHTLTLDSAQLATITPWRTDCATLCTTSHYTPASGGAGFDYCMENPCGAMSSVRAPRAGWCPGSTSEPFVWQPDSLNAEGAHTLGISIANVAAGAQWRVSATVFAYGGPS